MSNKGFIELPRSKLIKADWNYKENDSDLQNKLQANIKKNGQIENIIVRDIGKGKFEIINGNHRLDCFFELDINQVMVYNLGKIDIKQAQRIAIETNETKFKADNFKLAELLKDISTEFDSELLDTIPFTENDMKIFNDLGNITPFEQGKGKASADYKTPFDADFDQKIELKVTNETHNIWMQWCDKLKLLTGVDNPSRAFEYAVIEALQIPDESLSK